MYKYLRVPGWMLVFGVLLVLCLTGCGRTDNYTATVTISGVVEEGHAGVFKVLAGEFGYIDFKEEDFASNELKADITLSDHVPLDLVFDFTEIEGFYLTELTKITVNKDSPTATFAVDYGMMVENFQELEDALASEEIIYIGFADNIETEGELIIDRPVNMDLDNRTLENKHQDHGIYIDVAAVGTIIKNGTIKINYELAELEIEGEVTLENLKIDGGFWYVTADIVIKDLELYAHLQVSSKMTLEDRLYVSPPSILLFFGEGAQLEGNGNEVGCGAGGLLFNQAGMLVRDVILAGTLECIEILEGTVFDGVTIDSTNDDAYIYIRWGKELTFNGTPSIITEDTRFTFCDDLARIIAEPLATDKNLLTMIKADDDANTIGLKLSQDLVAGDKMEISGPQNPSFVTAVPDKFDADEEGGTLTITVKDGETITAGTEIIITVISIDDVDIKIEFDGITFVGWND